MFNDAAQPMQPDDEELVAFNTAEKARKVFFYQRKNEDGEVIKTSEVFACYEQEAGMFGKFHKLIAVGDGETYRKTLLSAKLRPRQVITRKAARELLQKAFDAELAAAKKSGNKQKPRYQNVHFDNSILNHSNAHGIMSNFAPPQ